MHSSNGLKVVFCFILAVLVVSPSTLSAHAVPLYAPNVMAGEFAQYKVLKNTCQSSIPQVCQALKISLNDTNYAAIQVDRVSGSTITLGLISTYKNGTGAQEGALVDVATGSSNITAFSSLSGDYFVLAGNLAAGDTLWNTASAPTFNTTSSRMIVGMTRSVNFLNITSSGVSMGTAYTESAGFTYDQSSGFLIEIDFSIKIDLAATELDFALGMVDNNIWGTDHLPDFGLSANPATVNIIGSATGTTTITLTRSHGFSATTSLTANPSSSHVSCLLSSSSLAMGGPDTSTLSCTGSPGTYTVTVNGNAGFSVHSLSIPISIATGPDFTITNTGPVGFKTGTSGAVTITITAQNGYSATTTLEVTSTPSGLTCNLNTNSVSGYGSVTLTCSGQPGSYTVMVKATGGGTTHSTQTIMTVGTSPIPSQPATSLPMPVVYGGIGVAAVVAALVGFLLFSRKPSEAIVAHGEGSTPASQA